MAALLLLASFNPLDCIPVSQIIDVERVGNKLNINYTDDEGNRKSVQRPASEFILNQVHGYNIEIRE